MLFNFILRGLLKCHTAQCRCTRLQSRVEGISRNFGGMMRYL